MKTGKKLLILFMTIAINGNILGQVHINENPFRQLVEELPTPNAYRSASGRPGQDYFQQKVDYDMDISLDEVNKSISGQAVITYHNNSPQALDYLWLQLDQNVREPNSFKEKISTDKMPGNFSPTTLEKMEKTFEGGFVINYVQDSKGNNLETVKNHTLLKVLLPEAIPAGKKSKIRIKWHYNLNNLREFWGRSGYDSLTDQNETIFAIAQFYPRLCVFNDLGWQIKQFVDAEFALEFGDYNVTINVPSDHIVAASGILKNQRSVLSPTMQDRLTQARKSDEPVLIVTPDEAAKNRVGQSSATKNWKFYAENVRDFAFASSRTFIWDAMRVHFPGNNVLAMSFYPKEANPLWEKYSTKTIARTLQTYSRHTFDYPYPTASVVSVEGVGMEYPMLGFVNGRPKPDGSYAEGTKNWVIGTVRHEVGHNYFPMIVNSDERQWAWMDEGFNIFLQGIAERQWNGTRKWSGRPTEMQGYMDDEKSSLMPLMTSADALLQPGMNSYRKPAVGLTILRETILGRELFDQAFKEYAQTWMFKHPQPADFFRIMEDASGVDLDWFWRGWFFSTEHVDMEIKSVTVYDPVLTREQAEKIRQETKADESLHIADIRDQQDFIPAIEQDPSLKDRYDTSKSQKAIKDYNKFKEVQNNLPIEDRETKFYEITFSALGGMLMPLIVQFEFEDGSKDLQRIPAEIWMKNRKEVTKIFKYRKEVKNIILDPYLETADINMKNNYWPRKIEKVYLNLQE